MIIYKSTKKKPLHLTELKLLQKSSEAQIFIAFIRMQI